MMNEKKVECVADYINELRGVYINESNILAKTLKKLVEYLRDDLEFSESTRKDYCFHYFDSYWKFALQKLSDEQILKFWQSIKNTFNNEFSDVFDAFSLSLTTISNSPYGERIKKIKQLKKEEGIKQDFEDDNKKEADPFSMPYSQFFFRGHADKDWNLNPFAFRNQYDESLFYHEMQRLEPDVFKNNSVFDNLALMQHYGCPTRLLDVSFNPLVSLYFACNDKFEKDGKVFVFNRLNFANEDDANIISISKLALLTEKEKEDFKADVRMGHLNTNGSYCRVMEASDLVLDYFLEPVLVKSKYLAPRIKQQAGAFAIASLDGQKVDAFMKTICCDEILIPTGAKENILKELDQMCINEYYLFDGLEHVAGYLKKI